MIGRERKNGPAEGGLPAAVRTEPCASVPAGFRAAVHDHPDLFLLKSGLDGLTLFLIHQQLHLAAAAGVRHRWLRSRTTSWYFAKIIPEGQATRTPRPYRHHDGPRLEAWRGDALSRGAEHGTDGGESLMVAWHFAKAAVRLYRLALKTHGPARRRRLRNAATAAVVATTAGQRGGPADFCSASAFTGHRPS